MRAFLDKWALWIALAVLVAGVCAYTATRLVSFGGSSGIETLTQAEQTVPLDPKARAVAKKFVATAVARKNLAEAWSLASPELKHNLTLAQWKTGTIPVTPYPVAKAAAFYTVQTSFPDVAVLRVTFRPPRTSSTPSGDFLITLDRSSGKWLVSSWVPRQIVGAPSAGG